MATDIGSVHVVYKPAVMNPSLPFCVGLLKVSMCLTALGRLGELKLGRLY